MKLLYCLGLDVAKHKLRAALAGGDGRICFEADLPVSAAGRAELLAQVRVRVPKPAQLLVLLEATGVLHLNWSAAPSHGQKNVGRRGDSILGRVRRR